MKQVDESSKKDMAVIKQADTLLPNLLKQFNKSNELDYKVKPAEANVDAVYFDKRDMQYIVAVKVVPTNEIEEMEGDHFYAVFTLDNEDFWNAGMVFDYQMDTDELFDEYNDSNYYKFK